MTTYKFLASDSASAMEEVVKKLGPDALIVSTSKRGNKIEIEATDTIPKNQLSKPSVEGGNFSDILHSKIDVLREKQRDRIYKRSNDYDPKANFNSTNSEENNFSELARVKDQINELQSMLSGMVITDERSLNEKAGNSVSLKLRQLEFSPDIISVLRPAFDGLNLERGKAAFLKAFSKRIGCDEVNEVLKSKVIFIVGPSGVGKTTLLNMIIPGLNNSTAPVSNKIKRGKNTTRNVELFSLSNQSYIVDTPGFNMQPLKVDSRLLPNLYSEIYQQVIEEGIKCKFRDCLHLNDEGCNLNKSFERYPFYKEMIESSRIHYYQNQED